MNRFAKTISKIFCPWRQARLIDQLGGEAARECRAELWHRTRNACRHMDTPKIRGYVQAHAALPLAEEVERVVERHQIDPALKERIIEAGIAQMISLVVRDSLCEPYSAVGDKLAA